MKIVLLCPYGFRTGGPEAVYQLSDMLIRQGFDARLWPLAEADIIWLHEFVRSGKNLSSIRLDVPQRENTIEDYRHYRTRPFESYEPGERYLFVVPEVHVWMLPLFVSQRVLVWWLSVDNAFRALSEVNANVLRMGFVRHAVQSAYADRFIGALGLRGTYLSDYTIARPESPLRPLAERPRSIAISASHKVAINLDLLCRAILERAPDAQIVRVVDMSKSEVCRALEDARVFIDLGKFPGKDRMAREALLLGTNIVIGNCGSGACADDYPVAETYRVDPFDVVHVAGLCVHMMEHPQFHEPRFRGIRAAVAQEEERFADEVLATFSGLGVL